MAYPEPSRGKGRLASETDTALHRLAGATPIAVILGAGLILRLALLGQQQLFRDEAASWYLASHSLGELLRLGANETFPPLYAVLLKGWMGAFGDSEAALRSLSVVAGLGTILVVWRWARDCLGAAGGFVAAALVAVSPAMVAADRNARMYAPETFFATAAWWLAWLIVADSEEWSARRRFAASIGLGLAVAGEVWTLSLGIPMAGLQFVFACFGLFWTRRRGSGFAAGSIFLGAASLVPWLPNLLAVATNGQAFWTPRPDLGAFGGTLDYWLSDGMGGLFRLIAGLGAAIGVIGLYAGASGRLAAGADVGARRRGRLLALALALGLCLVPVVWLYSQYHSIFDVRYVGSAFPSFAISIAAGVVALARQTLLRLRAVSAASPRAIAVLVTAILAGSAVSAGVAVSDSSNDKDVEPARQVAATLAGLVHPGDVVITLNAQTYFPLRYYFRDESLEKRLGTSLYDWHRPSNAFFTGWKDIDSASILEPAAVARDGWPRSAHLAPGGVVWVVTLVNPRYEFSVFAPLTTGELRETNRIDVPGTTGSSQIRRAVLAGP